MWTGRPTTRIEGQRCRRALAVAALACCLLTAPASAQTTPDPFDTARHRSGALAISPSVAMFDLGVDTNVFNEVANPRQDLTSILRPAADIWLRGGRVRLGANTQVSYNYFKQFSSERYFGTDNRVRLEMRGPRVTPFGTLSYLSTRDRISPEVDARVRRDEWTAGAGADVGFGDRLTARLSGNHFSTRYNRATGVGGFAEALDRHENQAAAAIRYRLTPLTTLVTAISRQTNRFVYAAERNAHTLSIVPGVEFDRLALISGTGSVGFRRFDFIDPRLKDFSGVVAAIDLGYVARGSTRLGFTADRNVEYSYELLQPYYVSSGAGLRVTQQITERWSAMGYVSRRSLDYRAALPVAAVVPRTDRVSYVNGSLTARVSARTRSEFTASYQRRSSDQLRRDFDGLHLGGALFYEF